jgi:hypothetical protein
VRSGFGRAAVQTWLSHEAGEQLYTDDNVKDSHGTTAASKAAGRMYGVAKEVCYARVPANIYLLMMHMEVYSSMIMSFREYIQTTERYQLIELAHLVV